MKFTLALLAVLAPLSLSCCLSTSPAQQVIQLPREPDLSPDGSQLAFTWRGDIWLVRSAGGAVRQLTSSPDNDASPKFSPDGKRIAFVSNRADGSNLVFTVPVTGGQPKQLTFHTDGYDLQQWTPDGQSLLVAASRDLEWRNEGRLWLINAAQRGPEQLLFNAPASNGRISPDGKQLLFTREGVAWWRKQYVGSQSSQIWKYDLDSHEFAMLRNDATEARSPLWGADGKSFYFISGEDGAFNLYRHDLADGQTSQLTRFKDDGIVMPCLSKDGSTFVFRHLFDFYRMSLADGAEPKKIRLVCRADQAIEPTRNVTLESATEAAYSTDGLQIAFIAGGDLWVMDTVLREPRQITKTAEMESAPAFANEDGTLLFASDAEGQSDIWMATRGDEKQYWWLNDSFALKRLTNDGIVESNLQPSPAGDKIAFVRDGAGIWLMNLDGSDPTRFFETWDSPEFDWSPDGKWLTWSVQDNDFNSDVFVAPIDGSIPPLNITRHPENDSQPVWSPDGNTIAFTGARMDGEVDVHFVLLQTSEDEISDRDRKLKEALKKFEKKDKDKTDPKTGAKDEPAKKTEPDDLPPTATGSAPATASSDTDDAKAEDEQADKEKKKLPAVKVDAEGIHERIRRVSILNSGERNLFWSPDSKKLAFTATIDGKSGIYTIEPPAELKPKFLTEKTGANPAWIETGKQILLLSDGVPQSIPETGEPTSFKFKALNVLDVAARYQAGFDTAWRAMRDGFYDGKLNNRNWDEIRRKYQSAAREAVDDLTFATVVQLMLGELNGSHLGFFAGGTRGGQPGGDREIAATWNEATAHFGLQFDFSHRGPGLLVHDVIYASPAWTQRSKIQPGEIVIAIAGVEVDPAMDLTSVLNVRMDRELVLKVKNAADEVRDVKIQPITYGAARGLLYNHWVRANQAVVKEKSNDRFGYVHIRGMDMRSFYDFERDLFAIASGKEGLVIDVRENGGGSTADHLLTVLTQPRHAITVPRNGGPGYPLDRVVYATWNKPITVLCNQNSFSNAEIFSHAIKTLKRGRLVGVPTAGGVISTGGTQIMDLGFLRMPFRGWYLLNDGEDMELNGAVPDVVLWPKPAEEVAGIDEQLIKAIAVLEEDVTAWKAIPQPTLKKASERPARK